MVDDKSFIDDAVDSLYGDSSDDDGFEEIPVGKASRPSDVVHFDSIKKATTQIERRRERRKRRNERTGKIAACCLLICVIIAVICALTLEREVEHVLYEDSKLIVSESPTTAPTTPSPTVPTSPLPTPAPHPTFSVATPMPTTAEQKLIYETDHTPSSQPTTSPTGVLVDIYKFEPVADTYVYLDGPQTGILHGREDLMWVQRGTQTVIANGDDFTLPNIIGLFEFDTTTLPHRSRWENQVHEDRNDVNVMTVTLRLQHRPKHDDDDIDYDLAVDDILPTLLEVYRLPDSGYSNIIMEGLTGEDFKNLPRHDTEGILVGTFPMNATDTSLNIDVTSGVVFPDGTDTNTNTMELTNATVYSDEKMIFLLKMNWEEIPRQGDQFHTRESRRPPQLIFSNMMMTT